MIETKHALITDYLRPNNPIFKNKHLLGQTFLGPGDPHCILCKGSGIIFELKCTCQDNYLVNLINYSKDNNIPLKQYYGTPITDNTKLDDIFHTKVLMNGSLRKYRS